MDIIEKLVISLSNVSSRKIIVYGINCKVPFDYPNLIKKELIFPIKTSHDKWFWKQQVCIESLKEGFDNYIWMDGDIVANINIELASNYFSQIENYPIGEIHVHDEQIIRSPDGSAQHMGEKICEYFNYPRKILKKDLHACFFLYNKNCEWFFMEILDIFHDIYNKGLYDKLLAWNDESLHNFMHNKYGFTKTLPLSNLSLLCQHDKYNTNSNILKFFYTYWNGKSPNNFGNRWGWNYIPEDKNQVLYFHENKNLKDADEMIEFIKMKMNESFNNSKSFFINKYKVISLEQDRSHSELNQKYDECRLFEYRELLNINSGDIVLDIGADIGFFERYSYLKMSSKIICFESDLEKFELLRLNSYKNTILFNSDISDEVNEYSYTIDYLFNAGLIDNIDFLKIDNMGKEEKIINGINETNLSKINKISIKWYNFNDMNDEQKNNIVQNYLKRGFNCWVNLNPGFAMIYFYKQ